MAFTVINDDCAAAMKKMDDASVDAVVTDPPYGLAFMGAEWDTFGRSKPYGNDSMEVRREKALNYADEHKGVPRYGNGHGPGRLTADEALSFQISMTPIFKETLRVAKPGAYLLCFGGTRTFHRMACAIENAGWEIRDCIMWVYGSGFPKSMDVSKAIDKAMGERRTEVIGHSDNGSGPWNIKLNNHGKGDTGLGMMDGSGKSYDIFAPATDEAKQWQGWGTCLKPAWEPIIVARKSLDGTVANNVLTWGVGALNIDGCRVPTSDKLGGGMRGGGSSGWDRPWMHDEDKQAAFVESKKTTIAKAEQLGRFPANLAHDGSDDVLALFPQSKGQQGNLSGDEPSRTGDNGIYGHYGPRSECIARNDFGSAARFFYCAKASKSDRGDGNDHPTVKPTALMEWLVRLVCRQGGVVLDPFCGSGSTGVACVREGMDFIGIERDERYVEIARKRIADAEPTQARLF